MGDSCITSLEGAWVESGFCAYSIPVQVDQPRTILATGDADFLVLERGTSSVVYFHDTNGDGLADARHVLVTGSNLNHGLDVHNGYVYASSDTQVFRWQLTNNNFLDAMGMEEIVVDRMNDDGAGGAPFGHSSRTLEFDDQGRLYVSVGSYSNIDANSFRARIRRFDLGNDTSIFPLNFLEGEVFADGLRNEVGLAFDRHGDLWGVENSADNLDRQDLGGAVLTEDNPAEELNRFREADKGKNWGYPMCWTEFLVPAPYGQGRGTIWAWPSFLENGDTTDEQCRVNTIPPVMALQGHSAPLGITFYSWQAPDERPASCPPNAAFPKYMDGYAFIAYHGSWNREIPTGYKVVYVEMDEFGNPLDDQPYDLLTHEPPNAPWDDGFRPVDVSFDSCGRLLISSDGSRDDNDVYQGSRIVRMESTSQVVLNTTAPTSSSSSLSLSESPSQIDLFTTSPTLAPSEAEAIVGSKTEASAAGDELKSIPNSLESKALEGPCGMHPSIIIGAFGCLWALFG